MSRNHRRALKMNQHVRVVIQKPTVSEEHLKLYDEYHQYMHERRNWFHRSITKQMYVESFLRGNGDFARELLYFDGNKLLGVALVDVVGNAASSVYFFHAPEWRPRAPGVFSVLETAKMAQQLGLQYQYLGYWIKECQSMAYKSQYRPHELLTFYPKDDEEPVWVKPETLKTQSPPSV
jgi:arginine-tRNA-protein transferase